MGFEKNISLYPERASSNLDKQIEVLKKIESGEAKRIELTAEEREALLSFENELGIELEDIYKISAPSTTFYLEYFLTDQGRSDFEKTTGQKMPASTEKDAGFFIMENRALLKTLNGTERSEFAGRSETFASDELKEKLLNNYRETGSIDSTFIKSPERINVLIDPQKTLKKMTLYRDFRRNLKHLLREEGEKTNNLSFAKREVLSLYKNRVNELIADQFESAVAIKNLVDVLGIGALSEEEKTILEIFSGLSSPEKNLARYDKFLNGANKAPASSGNYDQLTPEMKNYAEKISLEYEQNALNKARLIKEKGLDSAKLFEEGIEKDDFIKMTEAALEHYDIRSSLPESEYNPDREGPAPDNKWQFIVRESYKSMLVNSKQKVIKSPVTKKSVIDAISVMLGHEIEGHVLQHENKSKLPLRLFKRVGAGRSEIFAEGGAMFNQDIVTQEAFGFRSLPHAHYVRSMTRKLEGGNYLDCIKSFFESAQRVALLERASGELDEAVFLKKTEDNLELAIERTKRFFKAPLDLNSSSSLLSKSKETVYLEQLVLLEKLREAGLEKFAYIGGANFTALASLHKIGMLNMQNMKRPDFYALEAWNKIKGNYLLDAQN